MNTAELVNMFAMIEQSMNAVERILVYTELPPEHTDDPIAPPASWPVKGEIQFKNVQMSYREGSPLVLKDVSFQVEAGEKVLSDRSEEAFSCSFLCVCTTGGHRWAHWGRYALLLCSEK